MVRAAEEKVRELGARKIGAERWFSAIADVMINRTKSARSCARRTFIAHAKDLGLSTPCPQCTRPSLVWRGAAKEGISPSIYRFGFYLNLRLEVGGTYMLMCREFAKSCEESALAMIGHYLQARPEDTLWLHV